MAVTKIRKVSSWTLWAVSAISVAVLALFYFGGEAESSPWADTDWSDPKYTDTLLYWMYAMFAFAIIALAGFGIFQFITSFMTTPKKALGGLSVIVVFAMLLGLTYAIGNPTPLPGINTDSAHYNIPFWLKVTDMWLYSMYVLLTACILAVAVGSVKRFFVK